MASFLTPADRHPFGYQGVGRIFEYTNWDGRCMGTNCGQAAAATFLTFHGKFPALEERARQVMRLIERDHPPDNLGGMFGTSRRRVERICRAYGVPTRAIQGEAALKTHIQYGNPVIVMLGVSAERWGFKVPMGHWMVVYGYDDESVFITNWHERMPWPEFHRGWNAFIPRLINMRQRGLVALPSL